MCSELYHLSIFGDSIKKLPIDSTSFIKYSIFFAIKILIIFISSFDLISYIKHEAELFFIIIKFFIGKIDKIFCYMLGNFIIFCIKFIKPVFHSFKII